jgi:hypothetical protein
VNVAAADTDGDGGAEVIVGSAAGASHVVVFGGPGMALRSSFFAFPGLPMAGGVFVATGDTNGDGVAEIFAGMGAGSPPLMATFDARGGGGRMIPAFELQTPVSGLVLGQFTQTPSTFGVRVATTDVNGDGRAELLTGTGPGTQGRLRVLDALGNPLRDVVLFDNFLGGVFVG